MNKKKIFVIDDEEDIQNILDINLKKEGYDVSTFSSAEEAKDALQKEIPDLFILDIMMEGMDGYEFCRKIRSDERFQATPVIFLSVKSDEFDKILGLELGGDDYITKPFSIKELQSRIKAVFRRTDKTSVKSEDSDYIKYEGIELFTDKYQVKIDGVDVKLTKTEFRLLSLFLQHRGKIFTRDNIIDSIKGSDVYIIDRTIDVHIMNLRKKMGKYKELISTFSGVGYGIK